MLVCASCYVYVMVVHHDVCFFPVALLLDSSGCVANVRICLTMLVRLLHGSSLLLSGISGKMTVTLDTTTIFAFASCLDAIAMSCYLSLVYQASQIVLIPSNLFNLPSKSLFGYVTALLSPSYSISSCRCSCRLFHVGTWTLWDITISLI